MDPTPSLQALAPREGPPVPFSVAPFWIGSSEASQIRVLLPGMAGKHAAILEREDGFWISRGEGPVSLNGSAIQQSARLADGDVIDLAPGCRYRFLSGERAPEAIAPSPVPAPNARRAPAAVSKRGKAPAARRPISYQRRVML